MSRERPADTYPPLKWFIYEDDQENTTHVADGAYHDDGTPFQWTITPAIFQDKMQFTVASSTSELLDTDVPDYFDSVEKAKEWCQESNDCIIDICTAEASGYEEP